MEHIEDRKKSNFSLAFYFLDSKRRKALDILYAYCRYVDDLVDESESVEVAKKEVEKWKKALSCIETIDDNAPDLLKDLASIIKEYSVKKDDLLWILKGVEMDLSQSTYKTHEELMNYCDAVASAVGLCLLPILGISREKGYDYAIATGRALQLTNILRDVFHDSEIQRVYLPQEDLKRFNYNQMQISKKEYSSNFVDLMKFESQKAREYYRLSDIEKSKLDPKALIAAELMKKTYLKILNQIENLEFNVFTKKARLSLWDKFCLAISGFKSFILSSV